MSTIITRALPNANDRSPCLGQYLVRRSTLLEQIPAEKGKLAIRLPS